MVVSRNDPLESFFNNVQVAISPLESNFRNIAKNFEHCLNGNVAQLNAKNSGRRMVINGDDRKRGKVPINILEGIFAGKCGSKDESNSNFRCDGEDKGNVNLLKKRLRFDVALSIVNVINGFVQAFLSPFKAEKMGLQRISNEDSLCCYDSHMRVEVEQRVVGGIKLKEGKDFSFEYVMRFVFDQLSNFPKFDVDVQDHECMNTDYEALGMNGLFGNLNFARVGGVQSSLFGVPSMKDVGEECISNNVNREESGGDSPEKLAKELLSIPLSIIQSDSESISSESDTVAIPPLVEISTDSVLKSALAGGISCAFSTFLMHPIDTVKTQVQASTLSFTEILSKLPQLGARGLYMGSIPAIVGQFASHGLRTGICEASKVVLINVAPSLPEIQVQSVGSFLGTFLGTTMRIPCEVLKQRLQAGQFNHVGEALVGTWQQDGLTGFFRGTGMTLCRELPFYVAGSGLYTESKKAVQKLLGRELEPWETIAVGAISGGLTAVLTTPFDVIKTRMMTALHGQPTTMSIVALSILRDEGPLGLFRGAVPRFFWVAPLGAINFAGYELIRKAMD